MTNLSYRCKRIKTGYDNPGGWSWSNGSFLLVLILLQRIRGDSVQGFAAVGDAICIASKL